MFKKFENILMNCKGVKFVERFHWSMQGMMLSVISWETEMHNFKLRYVNDVNMKIKKISKTC